MKTLSHIIGKSNISGELLTLFNQIATKYGIQEHIDYKYCKFKKLLTISISSAVNKTLNELDNVAVAFSHSINHTFDVQSHTANMHIIATQVEHDFIQTPILPEHNEDISINDVVTFTAADILNKYGQKDIEVGTKLQVQDTEYGVAGTRIRLANPSILDFWSNASDVELAEFVHENAKLEVKFMGVDGKLINISINDVVYGYGVNDDDPKYKSLRQLIKGFTGLLKYSAGKALQFIKKHATHVTGGKKKIKHINESLNAYSIDVLDSIFYINETSTNLLDKLDKFVKDATVTINTGIHAGSIATIESVDFNHSGAIVNVFIDILGVSTPRIFSIHDVSIKDAKQTKQKIVTESMELLDLKLTTNDMDILLEQQQVHIGLEFADAKQFEQLPEHYAFRFTGDNSTLVYWDAVRKTCFVKGSFASSVRFVYDTQVTSPADVMNAVQKLDDPQQTSWKAYEEFVNEHVH
jgi:hypothetical protein